MLLWAVWHLNNVSSNPWAWGFFFKFFFACAFLFNWRICFLYLCIFPFFPHQCFLVFSVEVGAYSQLNVFLIVVTTWMNTENTREVKYTKHRKTNIIGSCSPEQYRTDDLIGVESGVVVTRSWAVGQGGEVKTSKRRCWPTGTKLVRITCSPAIPQ